MTDFSLRVGIDISAQQVRATWGTTPDDHRPVVEVEQSTKGFQQLIHQLHQTGHEPAHCQVVMEATGTYWMRLAYTLHDAGFIVSVVNPVQAHRLAQAQLRRAKDRGHRRAAPGGVRIQARAVALDTPSTLV